MFWFSHRIGRAINTDSVYSKHRKLPTSTKVSMTIALKVTCVAPLHKSPLQQHLVLDWVPSVTAVHVAPALQSANM